MGPPWHFAQILCDDYARRGGDRGNAAFSVLRKLTELAS